MFSTHLAEDRCYQNHLNRTYRHCRIGRVWRKRSSFQLVDGLTFGETYSKYWHDKHTPNAPYTGPAPGLEWPPSQNALKG